MRKIWNTLCVFVLAFCLFAVPAYAEGDVYTADDVLHYDGLATRVQKGTGIRSLWKVDRAKITALENEGYTVSFGAVMAVAEYDGTVLTYGGAPVTAESITPRPRVLERIMLLTPSRMDLAKSVL